MRRAAAAAAAAAAATTETTTTTTTTTTTVCIASAQHANSHLGSDHLRAVYNSRAQHEYCDGTTLKNQHAKQECE